ncbi:MAG TPA: DCC1-like thiol-disulfide oxidoreductase family protein [Prosthecobacter sp.]|nr:DCC1-like thiol-disulfide oxidoreductase family protein [Prosthecobacter sp.]
MNTLTIFYDARCGLCSTVRRWLSSQPAYVRLEFLAYDSPEAHRRLPALQHLRADEEIVVMLDTGAGAWVVCLWALRDYRSWSTRLANPAMQALARSVVHWVSRNRISLSQLMRLRGDKELRQALPEPASAPSICRTSMRLTLSIKFYTPLPSDFHVRCD